jgi:hypothetical protein
LESELPSSGETFEEDSLFLQIAKENSMLTWCRIQSKLNYNALADLTLWTSLLSCGNFAKLLSILTIQKGKIGAKKTGTGTLSKSLLYLNNKFLCTDSFFFKKKQLPHCKHVSTKGGWVLFLLSPITQTDIVQKITQTLS